MEHEHQLLGNEEGHDTMLSNKPPLRHRGVTLIELMVGLTILAFLLLSGAPSLSDWIRNSQIRSTAESMLSGLQHARAEAVRRNTAVRFQLTSSLDNDCALSTAGKNWVINRTSSTSPAGNCGNAPNDTQPAFMLQKGAAGGAAAPITVEATQSTVTFNGFGQQSPTSNPDLIVTTMTIDVKPSTGTCLADKGSSRCLRIVVSPGGQARMCDPSLTGSSTTVQPLAC